MRKNLIFSIAGLLGPLAGCESSPAATPVWVHIAPEKVQPSSAEMLEMQAGSFLEFRAQAAIQVSPADLPVNYLWFADDGTMSALPIPQTIKTCILAQDRCVVPVCDLPWQASGYVRVQLVVASRKLVTNASNTLDFPEGTALDAVDWLVHVQGCH